MAYLFVIEDKKVFPNPETLLISPFKEIWERDKSPNKEIALQEFTFIEFMTSHLKTNPYKGYSEDVKEVKIKEDVIKNSKWSPDKLILSAMKKIESFQKDASPTYTLYKDCLESKEKVQKFLTFIDLSERTNSGGAVYKPKDIMDAVEKANSVAKSLSDLKKKVEEELFEATKTRANKEISPFAKPSSLGNIE
jgi:hypothetical protein